MEAETTKPGEAEPDLHSIASKEAVISKFASLLGMGASEERCRSSSSAVLGSDRSSATIKEFGQCLSNTEVDDNDVVCTLPSLDICAANSANGNDPLPELGKTQNGRQHGEQKIPAMAASVVPPDTHPTAEATTTNLSAIASWTKSSLVHAPGAISKSLLDSFSSLVDSRTKEWTLVLLRHSLLTGDATSRSQLLSMLSSKVEFRDIATSFKTLPLPENIRGQADMAHVVLPLLFEAVLTIAMQGSVAERIVLRAPGTISGCFGKKKRPASAPGLTKVEIRFNTVLLLEAMLQQARIIVVKAVEQVTILKANEETKAAEKKVDLDKATGVAPSGLSKFTSALSLSSRPPDPDEPPGLQKARASALRLNEVLQNRVQVSGKSETGDDLMNGPLSKSRKIRSVTWNHPLEPPTRDSANLPAGKRPRVQPGAHIKSIKSFGRPHADDVQNGPKNATFCEFGRSVGNQSIWGRDGRMRSHPMPEGGMASVLTDEYGGGSSGGTRNAAFDMKQPRVSSLHGLTLKTKKYGDTGGLDETERQVLPRTATALETLLLNTATRGGETQNSDVEHGFAH